MIVSRGIIAPNKFWWTVSESMLQDASGVQMYRRLKYESNNSPMTSVNFLGTKLLCVFDVGVIKEILDGSPHLFGVGKFKKNFFSSFMSKNVGVSEGSKWIERRYINEKVLESDKLHRFSQHYFQLIGDLIDSFSGIPEKFPDFESMGQKAVMKIVFGSNQVIPEIFTVFEKANSIWALGGIDLTSDPEFQIYIKFLKENINSPNKGSLVELATSLSNDKEEIIHQIPHWIFPLIGQFNMTIPRILLLLANHPSEWTKIYQGFDNILDKNHISIYDIWNFSYLRKVILETLRLNNPVVTTFRTLLEDYKFTSVEDMPEVKKGQQFVILNNPVLRDKKFWKKSDEFIPSRWTPELEKSYYSIMFNQGPQKCPGKEFALVIIQCVIFHIFRKMKNLGLRSKPLSSPRLNIKSIEQMINPFSIKFEWK